MHSNDALARPEAPTQAEIDFYRARAERLRSEAMTAATATAWRGLVRLLRRAGSGLGELPRARLWRLPGTGNCLNC